MTSTPAHPPRPPQGSTAQPGSESSAADPVTTERVPWDASTALDEAMARLRSVLDESKSALAEAADPTPAAEPELPRTPSAGPARPTPSVGSPTPRTVSETASATSPGLHTGSHARIEPTTPRPRTASPRRPSANHSARPVDPALPLIEPDPLPTPSAAADTAPVHHGADTRHPAPEASVTRSFDQVLAGERPSAPLADELPSAYDTPLPRAAAAAPAVSVDEPVTAAVAPRPQREPKPPREPRPRRTSKRTAAAPTPKPQRKPASDTPARIRIAERLSALRELWRIRRVRVAALAVGGALILAAVAVPVVTQLAVRSGAAGAAEAGTAEGLSGEDLLAEVGTLMVLPEETPTIATVEDPATLSTEPFFARAETGDRVLIFPESRLAVLYRESQHIIVNAGTLSIGVDPDGSDQAPSEEAAEPPAEEVPQTE